MADQKPTPSEILAKIRAAKAGGAETPPPEAPAPAPEAVAETPTPAAASVTPAAADKPKSPAEIMAAIRANKAAAGTAPVASAPAPAAVETPAPAGDKPKSAADIMAAIRANKAAGGAPAAAPVAAAPAKTAAAKTPVAAAAAGDRPSVQEMLKAVKQAESGVPVAATAAPAKPKLPTKAATGKKEAVTRRSLPMELLATLTMPYYLAWGLMAAIGGVWSLAIARFMMPNVVLELPSKFKIGPMSDYPFGKVSEKFKPSRGVYIVNTDFEGSPAIYALSSVCTHLGCTPSWLEAEQKFKCPCHGSGFYITGVNFEGPAPRPLERVGLSLSPDGQLEVDKSVKFQDELGQWQDPKSYVRLV